MNEQFIDFLTILLPTYFFFYMAITLIYRNKKSGVNRIAGLLMLAFLFYFLGEYIKTALLPQYQAQIVLYGNAPMLLFIICFLVHLCILLGSSLTSSLKRWLPLIYSSPFILWIVFLTAKDHRELYNSAVTDGRSPLDPLFLFFTILFVAGYILISVLILAVCWLRAKEPRLKTISGSLLLSLLSLFMWFIMVTFLLQSQILNTRNAMILYFIGYSFWAALLRHFISKYNMMPDYRKLFQILFKSAPTAILLLDRNGVVREINPRAEQCFKGIPIQDIPKHIDFNSGLSLSQRLDLFVLGQDSEPFMEVQIKHRSQGDLDFVMGLESIEGANEELFVMHLTDVTSLKNTERKLLESEKQYKYLAHYDPLTALYNRAAIQEQLQQMIANHKPFALAFIDLDHFKPVNDTYGHYVGDLYLKYFAELLKQCSKPDDLIGRIGGDEFVLISPCSQDTDEKELIHRRLSLLSGAFFKHQETEIPILFSAGISVYPRDASDLTKLFKNADKAMYTEKQVRKHRKS